MQNDRIRFTRPNSIHGKTFATLQWNGWIEKKAERMRLMWNEFQLNEIASQKFHIWWQLFRIRIIRHLKNFQQFC